MSVINSCRFMGRLVDVPNVKSVEGGLIIAEFRIALNTRYKGKAGEIVEKVEYVDLKSFGGQAEVVGKYFTKGRMVLVECRYELERWEKDGQPQSRPRFILEGFEFVDRPKGNEKETDESE